MGLLETIRSWQRRSAFAAEVREGALGEGISR
jgi:hypothetical protein